MVCSELYSGLLSFLTEQSPLSDKAQGARSHPESSTLIPQAVQHVKHLHGTEITKCVVSCTETSGAEFPKAELSICG